jgi:hypothetical protein
MMFDTFRISTMRLNFTCSDVSTLKSATRTLGEVLAEAIDTKQGKPDRAEKPRGVHAR